MTDKNKGTSKKEIIGYIIRILFVFLAAQHLSAVVSGSMEPSFYRGDIVVLEKTSLFGLEEFSPDDVKVGDIIVYDSTGAWNKGDVIHRVIDIQNINGTTLYVTKGDHNPVHDPFPVSSNQIKDRVITIGDSPLIIPKVGYFSLWIKGL